MARRLIEETCATLTALQSLSLAGHEHRQGELASSGVSRSANGISAHSPRPPTASFKETTANTSSVHTRPTTAEPAATQPTH